jgi:hypothetical protein
MSGKADGNGKLIAEGVGLMLATYSNDLHGKSCLPLQVVESEEKWRNLLKRLDVTTRANIKVEEFPVGVKAARSRTTIFGVAALPDFILMVQTWGQKGPELDEWVEKMNTTLAAVAADMEGGS